MALETAGTAICTVGEDHTFYRAILAGDQTGATYTLQLWASSVFRDPIKLELTGSDGSAGLTAAYDAETERTTVVAALTETQTATTLGAGTWHFDLLQAEDGVERRGKTFALNVQHVRRHDKATIEETWSEDSTVAVTVLQGPPGPKGDKGDAGDGGGGGGVTDHGDLDGLADDDHSQYALADGSRGAFATEEQGNKADSAVQPEALEDYYTASATDDLLADKVDTDDLGAADGVATLGADGKLTNSQIPDALLTGLTYQGAWDAGTNDPEIPAAAAGNQGNYYVVSVAGDTDIDGETDWEPGDWLVSNGTAWDKIDNTEPAISTVGISGEYGDLLDIPAAIAAIDGLTPAAGKLAYYTGASAAALTDLSSYGRTLIALADAEAARTSLGLGTASLEDAEAFATAEQGGKADTAIQHREIGLLVEASDTLAGDDACAWRPAAVAGVIAGGRSGTDASSGAAVVERRRGGTTTTIANVDLSSPGALTIETGEEAVLVGDEHRIRITTGGSGTYAGAVLEVGA